MTKEELAMFDFALKLAPFGIGDEHILTEFGVFPTVFYRRLQRLLTRHPIVNDSVRRRLNELCTLKLAPTDRDRDPSHTRVGTLRHSLECTTASVYTPGS
ncbi:hypothetical protein [Rhodococcus sp. LB1]|uniref:hypothetical protein n=1 Tax=Rhodococcus sp. LB1 TaxID=1807499 RepID=UPI00077A52B9|nr:hypothetical protein [Rhodococcus sp. LB1]KXX55390.1 hypothetical protein AZG88_02485 [Rhodococcus sp. LB1]